MNELSPVDKSKLDDLWEIDPSGKLLRRVLDIFLTTHVQYLVDLDRAIRAESWDDIVHIAHRFRSGIAQIGASPAAALCRSLELHAENFDLARVNRVYTEFKGELSRVCEYLERYQPEGL